MEDIPGVVEILGKADLATAELLRKRYAGTTIRSAAANASVAIAGKTARTNRWHQDISLSDYLVLWADDYPTEILVQGQILRPEPGDVVLIHNRLVEHRVPSDYLDDVQRGVQRPRHFLRIAWDGDAVEIRQLLRERSETVTTTTRYATIPHGALGNREAIARYLPSNYQVLGGDDETTLIGGHDDAGWTLDDYVLPRLASGLYFGAEVDLPSYLRSLLDGLLNERTAA